MFTVIHTRQNRTVWRGLARRGGENARGTVHRRARRKKIADSVGQRAACPPRGALFMRRNEALTSPELARKFGGRHSRDTRCGACGHLGPAGFPRRTPTMEGSRKPLAKVEGRRRMRLSGVTVAWRGTPNLDDWVAYIVNGMRSKKLILADHASERKVKSMLARLQTLSKKEIEKLAKG
jgi:hypothetical protein